MENEAEINKSKAAQTDRGYSEENLATQVDLLVSSKQSQVGQVFTAQKKTQTVFQAQKLEEK